LRGVVLAASCLTGRHAPPPHPPPACTRRPPAQEYIFNFNYGSNGVEMDVQQRMRNGGLKGGMSTADAPKVGAAAAAACRAEGARARQPRAAPIQPARLMQQAADARCAALHLYSLARPWPTSQDDLSTVKYQVTRLMRMLVQICQTLDRVPEEVRNGGLLHSTTPPGSLSSTRVLLGWLPTSHREP